VALASRPRRVYGQTILPATTHGVAALSKIFVSMVEWADRIVTE
jgi:hypothetical protein